MTLLTEIVFGSTCSENSRVSQKIKNGFAIFWQRKIPGDFHLSLKFRSQYNHFNCGFANFLMPTTTNVSSSTTQINARVPI